MTESLGKRLFKTRLELIAELDQRQATESPLKAAEIRDAGLGHPESEPEVRAQVAALLRTEVAAMNLDNFVVRPRRKLIEKYRNSEA
ncbi:MAG: hypothetical protein GEV05_07495 [Betaproteobacteria bacterium]|nr:hypothetical protein [Betaproteobacteria bacterium]